MIIPFIPVPGIRYAACAFLLLAHLSTRGATCTAIVNGNWAAPETWNCGAAPAAGDILVIPSGIMVTVTGNHSYSGATMRIKVYGALFFDGGGSKLSLPCGSIVEIMSPTSSISGNNSGNSQSIKICGITYWQVSNGTQTGYLAWPPNSTLPVELIGFSGEQVGDGVQLRWTTATELNSDRFELLREHSGEPVFLGTVPASGTTQEVHTYGLRDIPPGTGTWLYTLVQFDLDGTSHSLATIAVRTDATGELLCFPLPASVEVTISTPEVPAYLVISDMNGNVVLRQTLTNVLNKLPIAQLPNGTYMAVATHAHHIRAQRLVVMH